MVFEDIHWSDPTTRESLDLLVDRVATLRVLAIFTFRPEFTPPWVGRPHVTMVNLNRLPPGPRVEMIAHVTGGKALPKEIADQIVDRTDGVPLFIEELTKNVVESGMVTDTGDRYAVAGPIAPLAIPISLHASLLARLDRLAPTREIAQIGSALGRSFSHEVVGAVAAMPQRQLDDALDQLVRAELIFRRGTPPDAEYTFKHALVQDTAYSTLLRSKRQQMHGRIAVTLEHRFPEIVAAQPALMAQHCTEAGLNEQAIGYRLNAGRQAVARSAMTEAVAQLQQGLDLLAGLPDGDWRRQQELDLLLTLGQALIAAKGYAAPAVGETFARAHALAEQLERPEYLLPLLYGQWTFHLVRSELRLALSQADRIEQLGEAQDDFALLFLGRTLRGVTCLFLEEFVTARALFEQCHGLHDPAHRAAYAAMAAEEPHARMLGYHAYTLASLGYIDQGRSRIDEALREVRQLGHVYPLLGVLNWAALIESATGSPHEAQRHAKEMVALANDHGFSFWLAWGNVHQGYALTVLGRAHEGLASITEGLSMLRATGAVLLTPWMLTMLAEAHCKLGQPIKGLNCLTEVGQIIEGTNERHDEADVHRVRGDLLTATGDHATAEQLSASARRCAPAECETLGTPRRHQPCPPLARPA
jgi:tetratricopeptide (TPR) repeat protein